jgi:glutamyl-Q tRNA(Asp) synthetase
VVTFTDALQGEVTDTLGATLPDFILLRKDGLFAYQLAVVIDDAFQGITHVVRGSDLLESTTRQIYLQGLLRLPVPDYSHLPVITNDDGQKFSKQNHAPPLTSSEATLNLRRALSFLRQPPPPDQADNTADILAFARSNWNISAVPTCMAVPASRLWATAHALPP